MSLLQVGLTSFRQLPRVTLLVKTKNSLFSLSQ